MLRISTSTSRILSMRILVAALIASLFLDPTLCFTTHTAFIGSRQLSAASTKPIIRPILSHNERRPAFVLRLKAIGGDEDDDDDEIELEDDDVPADWTEDDIAAELGDIVVDDLVEPDDTESDIRVKVVEDEESEELDVDDEDSEELDFEDDEEDEDSEDLDLEDDADEELVAVEQIRPIQINSAPTDKFDEEWDENEDGGQYDLLDDPEDPHYMKQKELVMAEVAASIQRTKLEQFDVEDWVQNQMTEEDRRKIGEVPFPEDLNEQLSKMIVLDENDLKGIDVAKEVEKAQDMFLDDPYPPHGEGETNVLQEATGITDEDMEELDRAFKNSQRILAEGPWDEITAKENSGDWDTLSNETIEEIEAVEMEMGGSPYDVTRWLLFDLDFNVTNLILAAVKHNPDAPILLQHWFPQLQIYERYQYVRDRDFDLNWDDVEKADIDELQRYYASFGYDEIPNKAPAETNIIGLEEMDEEEIKMVAFDSWMKEVYNPECDIKDFDDTILDEENMYSNAYIDPEHPDVPTYKEVLEDIEEYYNETGIRIDDTVETDETMLLRREYKTDQDDEAEKEHRGHLIIACTGSDEDLDIAEKITQRCKQVVGKQVFVETRLMALAREEDNVFEVWLESYEIDLLHSKKRATGFSDDWKGPAVCDDTQIEWLVSRVQFLISDDSRYSYRYDIDMENIE